MKKCICEDCEATPQIDSPYCFFHDPDKEDERKEAQAKGGKAPKKGKPLPPVAVKKIEDIILLMEDMINQCRASGEDVLQVAKVISPLAGLTLKAIEMRDYDRFDELERILKERQAVSK